MGGLANVREQLQALNKVAFTDEEWRRFVDSWLDKPSDGTVDKTRKIHDDYIHDFVAYSVERDRSFR